jgi:hypothetical protein
MGIVLFGYIVGNRGFAQLMPAPNLPLLPAEAVLLLAGGWWVVATAYSRRLPWAGDTLNRLVILWLMVGSIRLVYDLRPHGLLAVRDFAMVYYALFFFIAQRMAGNPRARRFLVGTLLVSSVLVLPGLFLTEVFPAFFYNVLTVRGTPLIYYKGDLAHLFIATASLLVFHLPAARHRCWAWPLSAGLFLFVLAGNSRSTLLGLVLAAGLLVLARRWRFAALQAVTAGGTLLVCVFLATVFAHPWAERKLDAITDRVYSLADIRGQWQYQSEESANKGDNNRFRLVWWKNVVADTWTGNPVFGLGFGHDLAHSFAQEYYPVTDEEFTARSPHNIFLTVFGRVGLAGLAVWCAVCAVLLREAWQSLRHRDNPEQWALWGALLVILVGACLGVVLESPMGALPFWVLLGLTHQNAPPDVPAENAAHT